MNRINTNAGQVFALEEAGDSVWLQLRSIHSSLCSAGHITACSGDANSWMLFWFLVFWQMDKWEGNDVCFNQSVKLSVLAQIINILDTPC